MVAQTLVIAHKPLDEKDKLQEYSYKLLNLVLEETTTQYGVYTLTRASSTMTRSRQFIELMKGENLHVAISPPLDQWREKTLRVPFPIQKGIASYRIFFILKKNKDIFKNVFTLSALKKIATGSNIQWSTTRILRYHQFNLITSITYKGLFDMLNFERFISFNRGINEIFVELDTFGSQFPNLTYDKHIAMFTYLPNYFYVSPKYPQLATRIEQGLIKVHHSGQLNKLFEQYFGQYIKKINLRNRRYFYIKNINLEDEMYQQDLPYILDFSQKIEKSRQ